MWLIVMFDLPVGRHVERKEAHDFRMFLLDNGFSMAQFSVYMRYCPSHASAEALVRRVGEALPDGGKVDMLFITDKQYEKIMRHEKGRSLASRKNPDQYVLL